jgi:uncharacterized membrane-anchored protein YitT (DUF2179 family)
MLKRVSTRLFERIPSSAKKTIREYAEITIGIVITAVALDVFLVPNRLAAGGVSGLATVLHYQIGVPVGATMAVLNLLLFLFGAKVHGWRYGLKTIYGAFGLSFVVDLLALFVPVISQEAFLGTLYGGILSGIGLGIVFRNGGNTGGTDIIAQILQKYSNLGVGQLFLVVDGMVMLIAATVFGIKLALYGMIAVIIMGRVIDYLQEGIVVEKAVFIISQKSNLLTQAIIEELRRGVTNLVGRGGYTGEPRETILCVVSRRELEQLKNIIYRIDPKAFIIITDVHQVIGEGFRDLAA